MGLIIRKVTFKKRGQERDNKKLETFEEGGTGTKERKYYDYL